MPIRRNIFVAIACYLLLSGPIWAETVRIFAAASLREAVSEIAQNYEAASGEDVVTVFASSSTIARQVAQRAPADVVLLADTAWVDWLVEERAVSSYGWNGFASNRLVLISRRDYDGVLPVDVTDLSAALGDEHLAMGLVDAVPAGRYGKAALEDAGQWDAVSARVVQASNVRAALVLVQRGEVPFGIGYASDLVALPDLQEVFSFDANSHPEIRYMGRSLTAAGDTFMAYLMWPEGQGGLAKWGFAPAGKP